MDIDNKIILRDKNKEQIAEVLVHSFTENLVIGTIVSYSFDSILQQRITEFEHIVQTQQFSVLDEIAAQLDAYNWQINGKDWAIFDFQVFNTKDISFRVMRKNKFATTDFIAELQFLTTEQGGRKTFVTSGYRPHIEFDGFPNHLTSGQQTYINQKTVTPGETVKAEISILSKDYFTNRLYKDMTFKFCEGKHIMGYGKIIELVNMHLKK
ncbi:hypothetical protein ACFSTE_13635 [Aquimarina hainanensis]|uniref:Translation elongation factor EFTu/EF1A C-terminal domain-containing protein n=1 Tax=Aquimarina hainanensis TaxID=1578017 RepID=A0ABW5NBC0_9FLAO